MTRYDAFIKVIETGSFSKAAEELGYTQSAVSQMVHSLEEELCTTLISRSRKGISLTPDGEEFLPYIKSVYHSHRELLEKQKELQGLQGGIIRIGTFSSVSCNWLPGLIKEFKKSYPDIYFDLQQGEYTSIAGWIKEGSVDFGFVNPEAVSGLTTIALEDDEMLAVLPVGHPLAGKERVSLKEMENEPYILLDEGELSEPLNIFRNYNIHPRIQYRVFDDYAIMAMIEKGLGVAILPKLVLSRCRYDIVLKEISPPIVRTLSLAYKDKKVLPVASRYFIDFILESFHKKV